MLQAHGWARASARRVGGASAAWPHVGRGRCPWVSPPGSGLACVHACPRGGERGSSPYVLSPPSAARGGGRWRPPGGGVLGACAPVWLRAAPASPAVCGGGGGIGALGVVSVSGVAVGLTCRSPEGVNVALVSPTARLLPSLDFPGLRTSSGRFSDAVPCADPYLLSRRWLPAPPQSKSPREPPPVGGLVCAGIGVTLLCVPAACGGVRVAERAEQFLNVCQPSCSAWEGPRASGAPSLQLCKQTPAFPSEALQDGGPRPPP